MITSYTDTHARIDEYFRDHTMMHDGPRISIRNTNRVTLAKLLGYLGCAVGVEIGVEQGAYSKVLCEENPGVHLYGVDPWLAYPTYREHVSQPKLDGFFETTKARLAKYHWTPIRKFSVEGAKEFDDNSLDFVYIDGAHNFINVVQDLHAWTPKVRPGGLITGHDYVLRTGKGPYAEMLHVVQVVNAWTSAFDIDPWYVFSAPCCPQPGELFDKSRSFMWVKE